MAGRQGCRTSVERAILDTSGVVKHPRTSINDLILHHLIPSIGRLLLVNPIRLIPVVVRNQTKMNRSIRQDLDPSSPHNKILIISNQTYAAKHKEAKNFKEGKPTLTT